MNAYFDVTGIKLETERLILREWNLNDLDDFFEYAKNPDVGPRAGWFAHENKEKSLEILNKFIAEKKTFAIVYKENNKVIGSLGIEKYGSEDKLSEFFDYQGREIGYVLSKNYWGRGLMTEAVKAVINYCFNVLSYDFLLCGYFDFNSQSKRVQEKCGFKPYRKLNFETRMGTVESGVLSLLINPHKRVVLDFSHSETLLIKDVSFESLRLELPSEKYAKEYAAANEEERLYSSDTEHIFEDNDNYLEKFERYRLGINLKPNYVPQTTLWLVDDKHFYGELHLRHQLNDKLLTCGGTIGYGIRWSKRGLGYGKYMLKLGLDYCKNVLDIRKAMITCNDDNFASEGVMLANGAVFGEVVKDPDDGRLLKKYWVNINPHIIECDRFYLREYQESDYVDLSAIYQDPVNMKYFGAPYDDKMMRRLIDWTMTNYKKYGFGFWAIIDKKSGDFIGDCGLSMQNIDGEWLPEIGYHIKLKYHNMGYASEAAQLVKKYIFKNYCYNSLYGYTTEDNIASTKVMIKNGMSFFKRFTKDNENYVVYKVDK